VRRGRRCALSATNNSGHFRRWSPTSSELSPKLHREPMMSDLLTAEVYAALAKTVSLPQNAFMNGSFRQAVSDKTFKTLNPATGALLTEVAACEAADVDYAVSKAREAFDDGRWQLRPPSERKAVLLKLARLMHRHRHEQLTRRRIQRLER